MHDLWKVCQDGRAVNTGLSRAEAERQANYLARGYDGKRAGTRIHNPVIEIKPDTDARAAHDANFKWLKENL